MKYPDGVDLAMYAPKAVSEHAELWIPNHCLASCMLTCFGILEKYPCRPLQVHQQDASIHAQDPDEQG